MTLQEVRNAGKYVYSVRCIQWNASRTRRFFSEIVCLYDDNFQRRLILIWKSPIFHIGKLKTFLCCYPIYLIQIGSIEVSSNSQTKAECGCGYAYLPFLYLGKVANGWKKIKKYNITQSLEDLIAKKRIGWGIWSESTLPSAFISFFKFDAYILHSALWANPLLPGRLSGVVRLPQSLTVGVPSFSLTFIRSV